MIKLNVMEIAKKKLFIRYLEFLGWMLLQQPLKAIVN